MPDGRYIRKSGHVPRNLGTCAQKSGHMPRICFGCAQKNGHITKCCKYQQKNWALYGVGVHGRTLHRPSRVHSARRMYPPRGILGPTGHRMGVLPVRNSHVFLISYMVSRKLFDLYMYHVYMCIYVRIHPAAAVQDGRQM